MARINDLIRQLEAKDPALANEISREVRALSERRAFGLNFERHTPEQVELPGRPVRKGDKVHILPQRGEFPKKEHKAIWQVDSISKGKSRVAKLVAQRDPDQTSEVAIEDLVVVAEFRDPIYPGLVSTGKVERGGDKPFHTVINGENFHALEALLFTHRGTVDAIYIDPPYNTGARDWKYNNDYVESDDIYRHSKWLAFMERRLLLAKELMNPAGSVLIVTIDEKEYLRIGLLLEQVFPDRKIQMISSVINPRGVVRGNEFSRTNEFIFFAWSGDARIQPVDRPGTIGTEVAWETMRRRSLAGRRGNKGPGACGPNQYFPIFVDNATGYIVGRGDPLLVGLPTANYIAPAGQTAVFPIRDDGTEMNWSLTDKTFDKRWAKGFVRSGKATPGKPQKYLIQYVLGGVINDIEEGRAEIRGHRDDGSADAYFIEHKTIMPLSQWEHPSHNAQEHGTELLKAFIPGRQFPYAKSLYAVEDSLRVFLAGKPEAIVMDYFAGSGTTAHAVMRLNSKDNGRRQSIVITNNEVSADERKALTVSGLRPGDVDWEAVGICDQITKPRILSALTGGTPNGDSIQGSYKFTNEFPMSDGFEENVEFFTLTYESPLQVAGGRAFERIAPLLWMRAGSIGRRIDSVDNGWEVADSYGVLTDLDKSHEFAVSVSESASVTLAFVFTDEDRLFEMVAQQIPSHVEVVRMNDTYIRNAEIEAPAVAR
jgi:adenine-specific DNA-methyltransferase